MRRRAKTPSTMAAIPKTTAKTMVTRRAPATGEPADQKTIPQMPATIAAAPVTVEATAPRSILLVGSMVVPSPGQYIGLLGRRQRRAARRPAMIFEISEAAVLRPPCGVDGSGRLRQAG